MNPNKVFSTIEEVNDYLLECFSKNTEPLPLLYVSKKALDYYTSFLKPKPQGYPVITHFYAGYGVDLHYPKYLKSALWKVINEV